MAGGLGESAKARRCETTPNLRGVVRKCVLHRDKLPLNEEGERNQEGLQGRWRDFVRGLVSLSGAGSP